MKLFNKNKGSGALIAKVGSQRFVIAPGKIIDVPDAIGEQLISRYGHYLQAVGADTQSPANKAQSAAAAAAHSKALAAKDAEISELRAELVRLQNLVANTPPVPADEPAKPANRGGRPRKSESATSSEAASE